MPIIIGDNGPNTLVDSPDDDTISGLAGNDSITVTNGNDGADGGNDFDTLVVNYGGSSADITGGLTTGAYGDGFNQNVGFSAFERFEITTGSGDDSIGTANFSGNDIVNLGAGNDFTETGVGDDDVDGGADDDDINVGTGDDTADGGTGMDRISANMSAAASAISWNLQTNLYSGPIGSFTNFEHFGIVTTGTGNDVIVTGTGNFADTVNLGGGIDTVAVVLGSDSVDGGDGDDILIVNYGGSSAAVTSGLNSYGNGTDRNVAFAAFERFGIITGSGADIISTASFSGGDVVSLGGGNDSADTGAGNDTLDGGQGNDTLIGGSGADQMTGGDGNDLFVVDHAADQVIETNATPAGGTDTVESSVTFTLGANLEQLTLTGTGGITGTGNGLNNIIIGNNGNNALNGGGGSDSLAGGSGDDIYFVDSNGDAVTEAASSGSDLVRSTISYTLTADVENLTLEGTANISGFGNALANVITGNSGNNGLNGGGGSDSLRGGDGNDIYTVDTSGDVVIETSTTGGTDLVQSSITFILGGNVENLTLTGSNNINGTGNGSANVITGNSGNNRMNGGAGVDSLRGGDGSDFYLVDAAGDVVIESNAAAAGGIDTVQSAITFILGGNVENLTLIGTAANGTGNSLDNVINGNNQANVLNGGAGADTMSGGNGNDTYQVDNVSDQAIETTAGGGTDLVQSSVSFLLSQHVDNLNLTGSALNATGNATDNTINGNGGDNFLDGAGGNDIINAADGDDTLFGGSGNDTLSASSGDDDLLGGAGNDTMTGSSGSDRFFFDTALNAITNVDAITDFSTASDIIFLDDGTFTGIAAGPLAASAFRSGSAALDADDRILHDSVTGQLRYDADGTGAAAAILFGTVTPGLVLTNADFVGI